MTEKKYITKVEEYNGEKSFILTCTQINGCTMAEQNKIVNAWCKLFENEQLPVEKLWVTTRISQKILNAVCCQRNLKELFIKWGVYDDVFNLSNLENLEYLHLGGGASLKSIDAVFQLTKLKTFESLNLFEIHDYSKLANLKNLTALTIEGDYCSAMKNVTIKSLDFLKKMPQLERLDLCMITVEDHSFLPVMKLPNLKHLTLPNNKDIKKDIVMWQNFIDKIDEKSAQIP